MQRLLPALVSRQHRVVVGLMACVFAGALLTASSIARAQSPGIAEASAALERGRYEEARKILAPLASQKFNYEAKILDSRLRLLTGDYDEAELQAKRALARARTDDEIATAVLLRGDIEALRGDYDAAIRSFFRVSEEFPRFHEARTKLGQVLLTVGRTAEARKVLDSLADDYNAGKMNTAAELTLVGTAVWRLEYYEDANQVLNDAVDLDPTYIPAYVVWGNLFLEKYNTEDAAFAFGRALKVNPNHPDALLGMARVELAEGRGYGNARQLIEQALKVNPRMPSAFHLEAQLQIDEEDYDGALTTLDKALRVNPNDVDALILVATSHYLKDDPEAFERTRKRVFRINPRAANLYTTVAEFGVRVHRYEEAIQLDLDALKVVPDFWRAFVDLGVGYTRIGDDKRGFDYLKKAFDNDPYNARAFNMVNLYEKTMPQYSFIERGPLRFRFHSSEKEVLGRVIPPVVEEAWDKLRKRYGFTPEKPVSIEVFKDADTFGVRSVGLPHISPHGICFGKVVTSRSPNTGDFNWAEVLWHELAHVFHIQMSRSRVPRWFTEGLAEYEASEGRDEWRREQDLDIVAALSSGALLSVRDLNRGFTQATSIRQIVTAYFQSTLIIEFIVNQAGFNAIPTALKLYGAGKKTPDVLKTVTGMDIPAFDRAFKSYLEQRYAVLLKSFEPQLPIYDDLDALKERARTQPGNAEAHANLAMGLFLARHVDQAEASTRKALALDSRQPLANFVASIYAMRTRQTDVANKHLQTILAGGHDGFSVQFQLGQVAYAAGRVDDAALHYEQAAQFNPYDDAPHKELAELYLKAGDKEAAARSLLRISEIDQNDPQVAVRLMRLRLDLGDAEGALQAGNKAINIQPFDANLHVEIGEVALQVGDMARARILFECALAIGVPDNRNRLTALTGLAIAQFKTGDARLAKETWSKARTLAPTDPMLDRVRAVIPGLK